MMNKPQGKTRELRPYAKMPECPDFVAGLGKKEWKRVAPALFKMGRLTVLDRTILEMYCTTFEHWKKCEVKAEQAKKSRTYRRKKLSRVEAGKVYRILDGIARNSRKMCARAAKEFGFRINENGMDLTKPLPLTGSRLDGGGRVLEYKKNRRGP